MYSKSAKNAVAIIFCLYFMQNTCTYASYTMQAWGGVNVKGYITESACTISSENIYQSIDIEDLPLSKIITDGVGVSKAFSLDLISCVFEGADNKPYRKPFEISFDGSSEGPLFLLKGGVRGIAIKITDNKGNTITPGNKINIDESISDYRRLTFHFTLIKNNQTFIAGNFFSVVNFKMDYF